MLPDKAVVSGQVAFAIGGRDPLFRVREGAAIWYCKDSPGQVAQLVERSPEKAGVGGSIPSLATRKFITLQLVLNRRVYPVRL